MLAARRTVRIMQGASMLAVLVAGATLAACSASKGNPSVTATPSGSEPAASATGPPAPTPFVSPADPAAAAAAMVASLSDDDLIGLVLMPAVNLDDPVSGAVALVRDHRLGGVILMGQAPSGADTAQTVRTLAARLQAAAGALPARAPLLVGTDQEYGFVTRVRSGVVQLPSAMAFGAARRPDLTETAWRGAASELAGLGINVDFAPDADVIGSAGNVVIGSRSFGADPKLVSDQVAAAVRGIQAGGIAATVKHFPGHGHTTVDSHSALPELTQSRASLDAFDLPPFKAGIDAGAMMVMAGHLEVSALDKTVPATFSHKVLTDLLRTQLGFTGVVVTDALNMGAVQRYSSGDGAVRSLVAGADLLLMPTDLKAAENGLRSGLRSGALPRERLVDAATRVLTLRLRLGGAPTGATGDEDHAKAARDVAAAAVTVLRGRCGGPLVKGPVRVTAASGRDTQVGWLSDALRRQGVSVVATGGTQVHLVGYLDGAKDLAAKAAVTVAMDSPYVLRSSKSPVLVATYSSTRVALDALADVLVGTAKPSGHSPVPISGLPRSVC